MKHKRKKLNRAELDELRKLVSEEARHLIPEPKIKVSRADYEKLYKVLLRRTRDYLREEQGFVKVKVKEGTFED
jgi:hypothetical protein